MGEVLRKEEGGSEVLHGERERERRFDCVESFVV